MQSLKFDLKAAPIIDLTYFHCRSSIWDQVDFTNLEDLCWFEKNSHGSLCSHVRSIPYSIDLSVVVDYLNLIEMSIFFVSTKIILSEIEYATALHINNQIQRVMKLHARITWCHLNYPFANALNISLGIIERLIGKDTAEGCDVFGSYSWRYSIGFTLRRNQVLRLICEYIYKSTCHFQNLSLLTNPKNGNM